MTEPDLFTPIARNSDPDTSKDAETRYQPKRGTDMWRVHCWYLANPRGATAHEYFLATKDETGRKRISDLLNVKVGLLHETGEVRDGGRVLVAIGA
jgi:hypothetical protein